MTVTDLILIALIFVAATLYSAVGHGGASGYLAAMALVGVAPAMMKPAALVMNIAVAGLAGARWLRAGHFHWRLFCRSRWGRFPSPFSAAATRLRIAATTTLSHSR